MYNKIRGYRNMLKLSQEEMGTYIGVTKQSYHLKETGKTKFTKEEMKKIKKLLLPLFPCITIDEIFFS